ncbi:MAG: 6-bladed beta-propeller [Tannerellaceae bacterium]
MRYISFLLFIYLFVCCLSEKNNEKSVVPLTPVINLTDNVSIVKSMALSDVAKDIEIVLLETSDNALLGEINNIKVTDESIWLCQQQDAYIYHFTREGKYVNKIGKIGQGPGEYLYINDFFIDNKKKEIYIVSAGVGIFIYDFQGVFKRKAVGGQILENIFSSLSRQYIMFNDCFYVTQNLPLSKPVSVDSLWSFALLDTTFQVEKIFKNPIYEGKESDIVANSSNMNKMVNYWVEYQPNIDIYNNDLTIKYSDVDTIYSFCKENNILSPQYIISVNEPRGSYEATHLWFKERSAFDYFSLQSYYPTKDFIYLIGSKGDQIYTYSFDKNTAVVSLMTREGEITERRVPWFNIPLRQMKREFILTNDFCGTSFNVRFRSLGQHWIDVVNPNDEKFSVNIDEIKGALAKDQSKQHLLIRTIENMSEDSNPILIIATLK